jgi:hypothetical protein
MSLKWIHVATAAAAVLLASGCSSDEPPGTAPSDEASASSSAPSPGPESPGTVGGEESPAALAPQAPLGSEGCIDVTSANLNLAVADNAEEARTAADVIAGFDPPASVSEALEHFVATGGVQFDDPEFNEFNSRIDNWVKAVCPL